MTIANPRIALNLIFAPAMWISSTLPMVTDLGRTIEEQSLTNNTLLVPFGIAFSIWFPIFIGCIAYAIIQARPQNQDRAIFKDIGWLTAGGFICVTLWGYFAAFPPPDISAWATALIFIPIIWLLCNAATLVNIRKDELSDKEQYLIRWPLSWIAGWCSLAFFLNWAQRGVHGPLGFGMGETLICVLSLAAALGWVTYHLHKMRGSLAYAFPVVWGLFWLCVARGSGDDASNAITAAAGNGIVIVVLSAFILHNRYKAQKS